MLIIFMLIIVVVIYVFCVPFRIFIENPIFTVIYAVKDIFYYFTRYKNIPKKCYFRVYTGLFGQGKTLSAVRDVISFYNQFNDKKVYDDRLNEYVTQKVFILSNVDLKGVPYRKWHSLQQVVNIARWRHHTDKKRRERTVTVCLGDEFSVNMNSRQFSKNLSPTALNSFLCSRHALIQGFFLTSQRFGQMDALLRQVTQEVVDCKKYWRFCVNKVYDGWEMENSSSPDQCKKLAVIGYFANNELYSSYDTLQMVENLAKETDNGSMIPPEIERANLNQRLVVNARVVKNKKRK